MLVLGSSASELNLEVFLLCLKVKEPSMLLVVEAIGLDLEGLQVALVLVEFTTRAIVFGSNLFVNSFKLPSLVVQECFYTTFSARMASIRACRRSGELGREGLPLWEREVAEGVPKCRGGRP